MQLLKNGATILLPSCSTQQWTHMVKVITAAKGGGCLVSSTATKAQQQRWSRWRDSSLPPTEFPDGLGKNTANLVNAGRAYVVVVVEWIGGKINKNK